MKKKEKQPAAGAKRVQFGIAPKLLLGILVPEGILLVIISIFLAMQSSQTVNTVMSAELDAEAARAASEVDSFFDIYYGIADCLAATQIVRDTTTASAEGGIAGNSLYGSLYETLQMIRSDNAENVDCVWVANLTTGELLQSDGVLFRSGEIDFSSRNWYQRVMEQQDTITSETYLNANGNAQTVTVASPVYANGSIQGIVGVDINITYLSKLLSQITVGQSGYITLYDFNHTIIYHPDSSAMGVNASDANYSENILKCILNDEDSEAMLYTRGGNEYYGSTALAETPGFLVLGVMPVSEFTSHTSALLRILIIGMVVLGVLLTLICVFIALSITRPLKELEVVVDRLANGELDVNVVVHGRDEVALLSSNTARIVERLKKYILYIDEVADVMHQIGRGNLAFTLQQDYVGEFAKVKEAMLSIRSTLTEIISSISQSADQVNAGAEQIASGAQAMAQGATEQAASVEELSSMVQHLSAQATAEADTAMEARKTLEEIKVEIDRSNDQMAQMRTAMDDISVQSTAIRSIIKTIDDIAFQTNILALNAAVEAARAGSAGKGFAVVADEVRSLAGKSAEAAQKTNELIENSVHAVQNGEELTKLTADSLALVAEKSRQVVITIENVVNAYHEQAGELADIAKGVDQISEVVQTNSATAEESAAASEELSGQANVMHQQVALFHLDEGWKDEPVSAVPAMAAAAPAPAPMDSSMDLSVSADDPDGKWKY